MSVNYKDVCGEEINADQGVITSPNYPLPYDSERRCVWYIRNRDTYSFNHFIANVRKKKLTTCTRK